MLQKENNMEILLNYSSGKNFSKGGVYISNISNIIFIIWALMQLCFGVFFVNIFGEDIQSKIRGFHLFFTITTIIVIFLYSIYNKFFYIVKVMNKSDYDKVVRKLKQEFSKFNKKNLINYGFNDGYKKSVEAYGLFNDKDFEYNIMLKGENGEYFNKKLTTFSDMYFNIKKFQLHLSEEEKFNSFKG